MNSPCHGSNEFSRWLLHMSEVLTANCDALGRLHFLVVSQGAFVFTRCLPADSVQSVGVRVFHQHFLALVGKSGKEGNY